MKRNSLAEHKITKTYLILYWLLVIPPVVKNEDSQQNYHNACKRCQFPTRGKSQTYSTHHSNVSNSMQTLNIFQ